MLGTQLLLDQSWCLDNCHGRGDRQLNAAVPAGANNITGRVELRRWVKAEVEPEAKACPRGCFGTIFGTSSLIC